MGLVRAGFWHRGLASRNRVWDLEFFIFFFGISVWGGFEGLGFGFGLPDFCGLDNGIGLRTEHNGIRRV